MTIILRCAAVVALCGLAAQPAPAQKTDWPTKPVRFIVPFPPGGTVDPLARLVGSRLAPVLGQQFIVDNRTGASGTLGTGIAAKATPDGYTFVFVFDMHPVNPFLIPNLPFDTVKDFAPVMLVATAPYAVVTHAAKPYRSFTDVVKTAKAKPDTVTFGSVGSGSLGHLMMTLVQQAGGFKIVHVPYKGGGPMTVEALGGNIELAVGTVALLIFLSAYAFAAMLAAVVLQVSESRFVELLYYAVAGLLWVLPAGLLIRWMQRPDPTAETTGEDP